MKLILANILLALLCAALLALLLRRIFPRKNKSAIRAIAALEELRSIGVLSVFKAVTKEIVTASDHSLGDFGKRYLEWLVTSRKVAMIFEFDIDFQFDLRDPAFSITRNAALPDRFVIRMPPCRYVNHIRNISFYNEQDGKLLPFLLPDAISALLPSGSREEDHNRLIEEARSQAEALARALASRLGGDVRSSARQTLEMLARGFGAKSVTVEFAADEPAPASAALADASSSASAATA